jgi:NAD(P)-dependent dehydrogenase (short-subunit alcohol dehydrogenase family)
VIILTEQKPLLSGFGPRTTAEQVLAGRDLRGKVAIVTGGHAGLGLETTRVLANGGATVVIGSRDPKKAQMAVTKMKNVEMGRLDLASPSSIDRFANEFLNSNRALDLLINNAGIMATPLMRDDRGYEDFKAFGIYRENGVLKGPEWLKNIEQGAATTVWCAVSPQLDNKGGVYCEDCDIAQMLPADSTLRSGVRPWAVDKGAAEALWILSEKLTPISAGSII